MTRSCGLGLLAMVLSIACGDDDAKKKKADDPAAKAASPRRAASTEEAETKKKPNREEDRPKACEKAEACCNAMAEFRGQDPGFMCAGVLQSKTGTKCEEFHRAYAGVFEASGKPVPKECE
jgi:hypothetical protein